ncbi:MAG: hypothetical protein D8M61_14355 [Ignavibacteriae bacterium]|nr:hypothetical protein [Ignavibacteriota bacterium]
MFLLIFYSCQNNLEVEPLKYSQDDLVPLNDSTKELYYYDAAMIELFNVMSDSITRYEVVKLDAEKINLYYNDLVYIYNNSYRLGNTFFENIQKIHSYGHRTLYSIHVAVDTNKTWAFNWLNGISQTGVSSVDSLIENYKLEPIHIFTSQNTIWYQLLSKDPINYFALVEKFKTTTEFLHIDPNVMIGGGSVISLEKQNDRKYYTYSYGWGDCPSGCLNYHYWKIFLKGTNINLIDEWGDPLL